MVYVYNLKINCFITFSYGYPQRFKQKEIWDNLLNIKNSIIRPWVIIGDFNEILYPHDKIGRTNGHSSRMQNFAEFINDCELVEFESFGLPYAWFNKRKDSLSIFLKV